MLVLQEGVEDPGTPEWEASSFHGGFSSDIQGQSQGHGQKGHRSLRGTAEDKEWIPNTKLGHRLKVTKIKCLEM